MSKNTPTLLKTAAELRSNGASWAAVGRSVGRSPRTCQQWPRLFRPAWDSLYQDAEGRRFTETGGEATAVLQRLLRDGDNRTKLRSADVLLRTRHQRSMREPATAPPLSVADTTALKLGRRFQAEKALDEKEPVLQCSADNLPSAAANDPIDVALCDPTELHSDVAANAEPDPAALPTQPPTPAPACPNNGSLRGVAFGVLLLIATLLLTALSQRPSDASEGFDSLEKDVREPARYRAIPLDILFEKVLNPAVFVARLANCCTNNPSDTIRLSAPVAAGCAQSAKIGWRTRFLRRAILDVSLKNRRIRRARSISCAKVPVIDPQSAARGQASQLRKKVVVHSSRLRLEVGAIPFPGLKLVQLRGRGGFAEVWEARDDSGNAIALKFISSGKTTSTVKEVKSLQSLQELQHPHLLRTDRVWSAPGYIVIAMELAEASLLDLMDAYQTEYKTQLPTDILAPYMVQVASGLDFMNARQHRFDGRTVGFQHCDVKPSNMLLIGDQIKLADFGLSSPTFAMNNPYPKCGTLDFAPPEIHRGVLSEKSDQYSLAVSYYYLRTGELPFPPPPGEFRRQYSYNRPAPNLGLVTRSERRILERALEVQPERRWENCEILIQELNYAWAYADGSGIAASTVIVVPASCAGV